MFAMLVARPIRVDPSSSSTGCDSVGSANVVTDATVAGDCMPVGDDIGTVDAESICMSAFRSAVGAVGTRGYEEAGAEAGAGAEAAFRVEV